jgi:hypothetical protein
MQREHDAHVEDVRDFVRRMKLDCGDLIGIGGDDLASANPARAGKARAVERCWALMARLGVKHIDLACDWRPRVRQSPDIRLSTRRHRHPIEKREQIQRFDAPKPVESIPNKINDLAISGRLASRNSISATSRGAHHEQHRQARADGERVRWQARGRGRVPMGFRGGFWTPSGRHPCPSPRSRRANERTERLTSPPLTVPKIPLQVG